MQSEVHVELEQRVEVLEREVQTLKVEIQRTLIEIRASLPEKPPAPARWQNKAWILALVNILLAVALFTNIYVVLPSNLPFAASPAIAAWLQALWLAIAFIWLLLQMYPLALLLEQEDQRWQGVVRRNATALLSARPGLLVSLTLVGLVVAIVNTLIPAAWLIVALAFLVVMGSIAVRYMLDLFRGQARTKERA
jgi:hypothetical protein